MRKWMKEARSKSGLTQQDCSEKLGMTVQGYGQIERNKRRRELPLDLAQNLADVLGIPLEKIIEYERAVEEK